MDLVKIIKEYISEDGTLIELRAESEDQMKEWDIERLTMETDPVFRDEIENQCRTLEAATLDTNSKISTLLGVYNDLEDFIKDYQEEYPRPVPLYDLRYQYTPSRAKALEEQLRYMIDMVEEYYRQPFPYKRKPTEKESEMLSDELHKLSLMTPDERADYLRAREDRSSLTQAWLLDMLERRRAEKAEDDNRTHKESIQRYRKGQKAKAQELAKREKTEEDFRNLIKKWVQHKQTAV